MRSIYLRNHYQLKNMKPLTMTAYFTMSFVLIRCLSAGRSLQQLSSHETGQELF